MKRIVFTISIILFATLSVSAQEKNDIIKTGYNFGPCPAIAFDADKGFQYGALLNIYNYGDGTNYPNYNSKLFLEASFFTKGSQLFTVTYDNKTLIPGVRWCSAVSASLDKAIDFYGFNGYQSWFDQDRFYLGNQNKSLQDPDNYLYTPYYRSNRNYILAKTDFIGDITDKLKWEASYHLIYISQNPINRETINKGKPDYNLFPNGKSTLYEDYINWGLISPDEAKGGLTSSLRLGLVYDSRDKEGAPTKGIWAEGHIAAAPKWLGTSNPFARYSITMRQYFPIVKNDVLTFAYRLNYEGTFGKTAPFYIVPFITVVGENFDKDGMGGYRTVRGVVRNRVMGLDMATYTAELRWRFTKFNMGKQNISFGLTAFSDGTMVTKSFDMKFKGEEQFRESYDRYMANGQVNDRLHATIGSGFRFIMNENFIIAFEYGMPVTHLLPKTNPLYNQDGKGAFYINSGYLF